MCIPEACTAPLRYNGFPNASANAFALSKRSAGSFSSDFANASATWSGTLFRCTVTDSAGTVIIFMMICCATTPVNGG